MRKPEKDGRSKKRVTERPPDTVTLKMQEIYAARERLAEASDAESRSKIADAIDAVIADVVSSDIALQG